LTRSRRRPISASSFDQKSQIFAHASGILLLTPDGRISRYFFGVEYPPSNVRLGLVMRPRARSGRRSITF